MGAKARKPRNKVILQARPIFCAQWPRDMEAPTPIADDLEALARCLDSDDHRLELERLADEVRKHERSRTFAWVTVKSRGRAADGWTIGKDRDYAMPRARLEAVRKDFEEGYGILDFEFEEIEVKPS